MRQIKAKLNILKDLTLLKSQIYLSKVKESKNEITNGRLKTDISTLNTLYKSRDTNSSYKGNFHYHNEILFMKELSNNIMNARDEINPSFYNYNHKINVYNIDEYLDIVRSFINDFDPDNYNYLNNILNKQTIYDNKGTGNFTVLIPGLNKVYLSFDDIRKYITNITTIPHELGHARMYNKDNFINKLHRERLLFIEIPSYHYEINFMNYLKENNLLNESVKQYTDYLFQRLVYLMYVTNDNTHFNDDFIKNNVYGIGTAVAIYLSQDIELYNEFIDKYFLNYKEFYKSDIKEDILNFNYKKLMEEKELILTK